MSNLTRAMMMGAAGASRDKVYVDDVFSTFLYEGTGAAKTITNGIDLAGEGGLVWTKPRDDNATHALWDTERGATKWLRSQGSDTESTNSGLTSFNSDGFTLGSYGIPNQSTINYVSWSFRKARGFFDMVTYTGNGATGRQISHNLGSVPGMIITKAIDGPNSSWRVWHRHGTNGSVGTYTARLNGTDPFTNDDIYGAVTQDYFSFGSSNITFVNNDTINYVAYIFAHDDAKFGTRGNESIIKCGSYTSTSGSDPHEVNLGFEPQWIMIKNNGSNSAYAPWIMFDNMRGVATGGNDTALSANYADAEGSTYNYATNFIDFTPTGFKTFPSNTPTNVDTGNFIYMAIRRPNKPPEVATDVFAIDTGNSSSTTPCWDSGFPVDFAIMSKPSVNYPRQVGTRLMGTKYLSTNYGNAEANDPDFTWDSNLGWGKTWNSLMYSWMFKRAPGFMDVVTYTGNLTARTISHNLSVIPELVIVKNRTDTGGASWAVWSSYMQERYRMALNDTHQELNGGTSYWNANSTFTTTTFGLGDGPPTNQNNHEFVGYLFASLTGISKIGTYSGTGSAINVDCGFDAGARFVLIKRTDAEVTGTNSSGWYVWDTARGIISGNDPYFQLNDNITQVTNTDYIDPLSSGFTVTASAPSSLNVNGGTYLFLAIA